MDYSKWKKILIILSIINLLFVLYNKVFATTTLDYEECLNTDTNTFNLNGYTLKVPSFVLDYDYIIVSRLGEQWNLFFSNDELVLGEPSPAGSNRYGILSTSKFLNDNINTTVYYYRVYNRNADISGRTLSQFNTFNTSWPDYSAFFNPEKDIYLISNFNLYSVNGTLLNQGSPFTYPSFDNSDDELQSLNFDKIFISLGDYTINDPLYLKILEVTNVVEDTNNPLNNIYYYNDLTFNLTNNKEFKHEFFDTNTYYYSVPYNALKLKKDKSYYFVLTNSSAPIQQSIGELEENDSYFDICLCDTSNLITTEEELLNSITNNTPSENTDNNISNNLPRPRFHR